MAEKKNQGLSYEKAYAELQQIVQSLQEEGVNIDELNERVARAATLIQFCRERLRNTETELQKIIG